MEIQTLAVSGHGERRASPWLVSEGKQQMVLYQAALP